MRLDLKIRVLAGSLVLLSLLLSLAVSRQWLWLAAFVGFNLIQSSFSGFCPAEKILNRFSAKSTA
jgi:hypothetical protein